MSKLRVNSKWFVCLIVFAFGLAIGLATPSAALRQRVVELVDPPRDVPPAAPDQQAVAGDHVELSPIAQASMGLKLGIAKKADYQSHYEIPAYVRELPGANDLSISSRFEGLIKRSFVSKGQTVRPGDAIFEIELTGELLATVQSELLDAVQQEMITAKEIKRLEPLVSGGGVATKRLLDLKYDKERLDAKIQTKSQELMVRGLTREQVADIIETRQLLRTITITVPTDLVPPQLNATDALFSQPKSYIVERLLIKPGGIAKHDGKLCQLAYHEHLVVEGQAYEKDLARIREIIQRRTPVSVSVGPNRQEEVLAEQQIAYLSNHADLETNTFPFYVYLPNQLLFDDGQTASGKLEYLTWKWKPGQRAHIQIPAEKFEDLVVLPREAVAVDGVNHLVFKYTGVVHHSHGQEDHEEDEELLDEFEALQVVVVHQDRYCVVIDPRATQLNFGDEIAINCANQLLFAMRSGGGHSHDHEH